MIGLEKTQLDWQEYIVAAIAVAACIWVVRRMRCVFRKDGGCSSCAETNCPLRKDKKRR